MPPATQPVPVRILDNLEAALALPDGGTDYFFDVNVVKIGANPLDSPQFPVLTIGDVGQMGRYAEVKAGSVLWHSNLHWSITVLGAVADQTDVPRQLLRLAADVYRAVNVDPQRGGLAANTVFEGCEIMPPTSEDDALSWIACFLDVHFRTRDKDMVNQ